MSKIKGEREREKKSSRTTRSLTWAHVLKAYFHIITKPRRQPAKRNSSFNQNLCGISRWKWKMAIIWICARRENIFVKLINEYLGIRQIFLRTIFVHTGQLVSVSWSEGGGSGNGIGERSLFGVNACFSKALERRFVLLLLLSLSLISSHDLASLLAVTFSPLQHLACCTCLPLMYERYINGSFSAISIMLKRSNLTPKYDACFGYTHLSIRAHK